MPRRLLQPAARIERWPLVPRADKVQSPDCNLEPGRYLPDSPSSVPNLGLTLPNHRKNKAAIALLDTLCVLVKAVLVQDQLRRPALAVGYKSDLGVDNL